MVVMITDMIITTDTFVTFCGDRRETALSGIITTVTTSIDTTISFLYIRSAYLRHRVPSFAKENPIGTTNQGP